MRSVVQAIQTFGRQKEVVCMFWNKGAQYISNPTAFLQSLLLFPNQIQSMVSFDKESVFLFKFCLFINRTMSFCHLFKSHFSFLLYRTLLKSLLMQFMSLHYLIVMNRCNIVITIWLHSFWHLKPNLIIIMIGFINIFDRDFQRNFVF